MLTLISGMLILAVIVIALYAFGVFNTPYLGAFRFTRSRKRLRVNSSPASSQSMTSCGWVGSLGEAART